MSISVMVRFPLDLTVDLAKPIQLLQVELISFGINTKEQGLFGANLKLVTSPVRVTIYFNLQIVMLFRDVTFGILCCSIFP